MDKKEYGEEDTLKSNKYGVLIFLFIFFLVWFLISKKSNNEPTTYVPKSNPSKAQVEKWNKEYYENGDADPDADISQQYGGR